jgi:hypothetical protein
MEMVIVGGLEAPERYFRMFEAEKRLVCNGAGSKGWGWLVPDTMWGLSVTEAANIHDYMYWWRLGRKESDKLFYKNMLSIINNKGGFLRYPRRLRAYTYYKAVRVFGAAAYGG